jgi:hypothetical protein
VRIYEPPVITMMYLFLPSGLLDLLFCPLTSALRPYLYLVSCLSTGSATKSYFEMVLLQICDALPSDRTVSPGANRSEIYLHFTILYYCNIFQ